jgi:hypothetical protein
MIPKIETACIKGVRIPSYMLFVFLASQEELSNSSRGFSKSS